MTLIKERITHRMSTYDNIALHRPLWWRRKNGKTCFTIMHLLYRAYTWWRKRASFKTHTKEWNFFQCSWNYRRNQGFDEVWDIARLYDRNILPWREHRNAWKEVGIIQLINRRVMLIFLFGILIVILLFVVGSSFLSLLWGTLYSFCGCDDPCCDIG